MNSRPHLYQVTTDYPLPTKEKHSAEIEGWFFNFTPIPSTPAYRPLEPGETIPPDAVFFNAGNSVPSGNTGQGYRPGPRHSTHFRPILTPSPITLEEALEVFGKWWRDTGNNLQLTFRGSAKSAFRYALQWLQSRQPAAAVSGNMMTLQKAEYMAQTAYDSGRNFRKDKLEKENAALREATIVLLNHIEDVCPDDVWKKIDHEKWNAVSLSGYSSGAQPALASTPEPLAKEQCGYYKCNRCGATEPRYGNAQHLGAHDCGTLSQIHHGQWIWHEEAAAVPAGEEKPVGFDFLTHLARQREWSTKTFGPSKRTKGVLDHIRKELLEIEREPDDLTEWIDVVILALDGAWRAGYLPEQILECIIAKQTKNEARQWPDWRTASEDKAIEHDRTKEQPAPPAPRGQGLSIDTAPRDGSSIIGIYSDGSESAIMWSDRPVCMAGSQFGGQKPGWATDGTETDRNLPVDPPIAWRESAPPAPTGPAIPEAQDAGAIEAWAWFRTCPKNSTVKKAWETIRAVWGSNIEERIERQLLSHTATPIPPAPEPQPDAREAFFSTCPSCKRHPGCATMQPLTRCKDCDGTGHDLRECRAEFESTYEMASAHICREDKTSYDDGYYRQWCGWKEAWICRDRAGAAWQKGGVTAGKGEQAS